MFAVSSGTTTTAQTFIFTIDLCDSLPCPEVSRNLNTMSLFENKITNLIQAMRAKERKWLLLTLNYLLRNYIDTKENMEAKENIET